MSYDVLPVRRLFFFVSFILIGMLVTPWINADQIPKYQTENLVEGLNDPYAFVFLPDGDILLTEKTGKLRIIRDGVLLSQPVNGLPEMFIDGKYCGLFDVVLHPRFEENHYIYLSFTFGRKDANATRVARARYVDGRLDDVTTVFTGFPLKDTINGPAGHLTFLPDETLLITVGDGFRYREKAQDLESMLGKVVRITDDGKIPLNNPFINKAGDRSPVWTYGHRISLGILYDPVTNTIYEHENGPKGGDELNILKPGKNYGWPIATYGVDYSGAYVSPFQDYPNTEKPIVDWTPSIAPAGITQCRGCLWSEWEGDLFIGMLAGQHVRRVRVDNGVATHQEVLFKEMGERIRNVQFGPDGALYVMIESIGNSRVIRIEPLS